MMKMYPQEILGPLVSLYGWDQVRVVWGAGYKEVSDHCYCDFSVVFPPKVRLTPTGARNLFVVVHEFTHALSWYAIPWWRRCFVPRWRLEAAALLAEIRILDFVGATSPLNPGAREARWGLFRLLPSRRMRRMYYMARACAEDVSRRNPHALTYDLVVGILEGRLG